MYDKSLPRTDSIVRLAKLAGPYPTIVADVLRVARQHHASRSMIDFLKSFPSSATFTSSEDFVTRSEGLELLIREERHTPRETARNAQE